MSTAAESLPISAPSAAAARRRRLIAPSGARTPQLLNPAGVFAAGFFMRPLGGWLFGWIADTHGRRTSMIISVLMMCAGSLIIGGLPTSASVGAAGPGAL